MTTTAHITATADQLAADLRERRNFHDGEVCDALFGLCLSCRTRGRTVHVARALVVIPEQRTATSHEEIR